MVMQASQEEAGRRLGTQPAQPSHLFGGRRFFGGTLRKRLQLGPGASESVEKPLTSSSVSGGHSSRKSSCSRKNESEPRLLESGSGGSTLLIEARGALRPPGFPEDGPAHAAPRA